jgi:hypothetical protein
MEGGRSANYWPGFVDALTNVVIAMVFVIVVLAIALSFAAQMMGKKMADELVRAKADLAAATVSAPRTEQPAEAGPPTTQPIDKTIEVHARAPTAIPPAELRTSARSLRLEFADAAIALDADATGKLHEALALHHVEAANTRVQITASGPSMALSDNQRTAYLRVLAVRNELLDEGFTTEHIAVLIDTAGTAAKPTVTVSFPPPVNP